MTFPGRFGPLIYRSCSFPMPRLRAKTVWLGLSRDSGEFEFFLQFSGRPLGNINPYDQVRSFAYFFQPHPLLALNIYFFAVPLKVVIIRLY